MERNTLCFFCHEARTVSDPELKATRRVLSRRVTANGEFQVATDQANWDCSLAWPVTVLGRRAIVTLSDARGLILNLPNSIQSRGHWLFAAGLLLRAGDSGSDSDVERATLQIERALIADGRTSLE
jgi:hypothetical protein